MAKGFIEKDLLTVKDFGISALHDLDIQEKVNFLETQVSEIKKLLWRERVNVVMSAELKPENEAQAAQQAQQRLETKGNIRQYVQALGVFSKWLKELKASKEYRAFEADIEKAQKAAEAEWAKRNK